MVKAHKLVAYPRTGGCRNIFRILEIGVDVASEGFCMLLIALTARKLKYMHAGI